MSSMNRTVSDCSLFWITQDPRTFITPTYNHIYIPDNISNCMNCCLIYNEDILFSLNIAQKGGRKECMLPPVNTSQKTNKINSAPCKYPAQHQQQFDVGGKPNRRQSRPTAHHRQASAAPAKQYKTKAIQNFTFNQPGIVILHSLFIFIFYLFIFFFVLPFFFSNLKEKLFPVLLTRTPSSLWNRLSV